jgi:hypothetical protein
MPQPDRLLPQMAKAVRLLLAGVPKKTIAAALGVTRMSLWRYLRRDDLARELLAEQRRREEVFLCRLGNDHASRQPPQPQQQPRRPAA